MEENKTSLSSPSEPVVFSAALRNRHVPDVPEDIDFLIEHLNDPNFDLKKSYPPSARSVTTGMGGKKIYAYDQSDYDAESHFGSERPSSRVSTAIEFDE